jgi:hypothetical protein
MNLGRLCVGRCELRFSVGVFLSPRGPHQCLGTFVMVIIGGCYWHQQDGGQGLLRVF